MNSKGHLTISIIKSLLRIIGCVISMILALNKGITSLVVLSIALASSEVLGIAEELVDKR